MTIGTGIFLASLVIACVAVFLATKDRWRWKRILLTVLLGTVGMAALAGAGTWGYFAWTNRVKPVTELSGIKLGMSPGDVKFYKGEPKEQREKGPWTYEKSGTTTMGTMVWFMDDKVCAILLIDEKHSLPGLFGLSAYEQTADYEAKLGPPPKLRHSADQQRRILQYPVLNLSFGFHRDELEIVGIRSDSKSFLFGDDKEEGATNACAKH